jgi:hypothetical protein
MTPKEKLEAMKAKAAAAREPEPQTEIEIAGVSFKGGRIFLVLTALSTLGGAAWGGFEFYNDYRNMKEQIQSYVAPDLSGFQEQLSVFEERMIRVEDSVDDSRSYTRDIRDGLREDITRLENIVEATEDRTKNIQDEAFDAIREMESQTREMIDSAENRFDNKRDALDLDVERQINDLEERMNNTIQRVLDNPLAN